ncbi:GTPase Era [candidate division KSB1 bacterium]|nr:GTPase Era [candidate division KSB1 bacterium]
MTPAFKAGFVSVVGRPNVGKSTLTNKLLNFKLCITTPKPQTTRHKIQGVISGDSFQIIFLDTPGIIKPHYSLHQVMRNTAFRAVKDADIVLFVAEATAGSHKADLDLLREIKEANEKIILVVNKIDLVKKDVLLCLIDDYCKQYHFEEIVPVSALFENNVQVLLKVLIEHLPEGLPFYPPDYLTEHPERFFVSEIIREKVFQNYGEEIPYSTAVVIDEFHEQEGRKDVIKARIIVEKQSQKGIIIGKKGHALRKVGEQARLDIEKFLGRPVFLELWVAVREKWREKDIFLQEFGYLKH